jgi:protein gp37
VFVSQKTSIEWTDSTWTPIRARNRETGKVGWHCEHVSPGCALCYAGRQNRWIGTGLEYKPTHRDDIEIFLDEQMLQEPLRWRKPRRVFVCSMTDLFADFVPDELIARVWARMMGSTSHTFQVLTKRAARAQAFLSACGPDGMGWITHNGHRSDAFGGDGIIVGTDKAWPLPNVWLGVSCPSSPFSARWIWSAAGSRFTAR